ncbi:MAG TPA: phage virion morphogenesis protein [Syntrophorhabdaceae bacterium]|nr:phage virion morphogenesis protein [Syntrophorhabdaceae bacterium]HQM82372.1 phage virion morphogenesis protein [Syntrophorhabdaceae bacterium]
MIEIKVEDKKVAQLLKRLEKKGADLTPVMRVIAGIMHDAVEENFEKEGQPKWTPLAKSTKKQRARKGHWPGKILQVSPAGLAQSISQKSDSRSARVGSNKIYAAIQQLGGKAGKDHAATIPARPFLKLPKSHLDTIKKAILSYLTK